MYQHLFQEGTIGTLTIKNRIIMESMGNALSKLNGEVSEEDIAFYRARAQGGVGLIMSEAVSVDSLTGRANSRNLCIDQDSQIPGYRRLVQELHPYNCRFFVELYHPGRQGDSVLNGGKAMLAPSAIPCSLVRQPVVEMTQEQIQDMVQKFIDGARRCQEAGVDGVLLHAAHGYLINQFLSPYTNHRQDAYGGSPENCARFALEILRGIRKICGPDYPIALRMSACEYLDYIGLPQERGITLPLAVQYARMFQDAGVDLLDISSGIYETMNTAWEPTGFDQGWKQNLAKEIRTAVTIPVVSTCVIRDPDFAESLLAEGVCDFVGSARTHLADPEWSNKAREGRECDIRRCISCLNCMKGLMNGKMSCAVNAQACYETQRCAIIPDGEHRPVVIIGGGPAGMEAARILAMRGFQVTLFEKESQLGGALLQAAKPPHKEKILWFVQYLTRQLEELQVCIHCGHEATRKEVHALAPYAVFVAAGARHIVPSSIPGITSSTVCTAAQILTGERNLEGKTIVVIGAGMTGLETAEYLSCKGNQVSVYDLLPQVAPGELFQNLIDVERRLKNVPQYTEHRLVEITSQACIFETPDGIHKIVPCDAVVLSMGMRPNKEVAEQFSDFPHCQVIGTNLTYSSIGPAVESGYLAAYQLT